MKKIIALFLTVALLCSFAACSKSEPEIIEEDDGYVSDVVETDNGDYEDVYGSEEVYTYEPYSPCSGDYLDLNVQTSFELEEINSINVHEIYIPESGVVDTRFLSPHGDGRYYVTMYTAEDYTGGGLSDENIIYYDENYLWTAHPGGTGGLDSLYSCRLGEGSYYIKVYADSSDLPEYGYDLMVDYTSEAGDNTVEIEYNDTEETATPIELNTKIRGNLDRMESENTWSDTDVDYYSFTLDTEQNVRVDFEVVGAYYSSRDYSVHINGIGNYSVGTVGNDYDQSCTKTKRLSPGTYYICFEGSGNRETYYFTVSAG